MSALPLILALMATPAYAQTAPSETKPAADAPPTVNVDAEADEGGHLTQDSPTTITGLTASSATGRLGDYSPLADNEVGFTANQLDYDYKTHIVTAIGEVRMVRQGNRLRADKVIYNRDTGKAHAYGNVAMQNPQGDISYATEAELTDSLKDGVAQDLLLVLENGGRLAAKQGSRINGVYNVIRGAYTPCDVTTSSGCPKEPIWKITAARVNYDPDRHRLSYRDARLTFLNIPLVWLPAFSHPDGTGEGGNNGLLIPHTSYNKRNGGEYAQPYYIQLGPNRDLTLTPHLFSAVLPMADVQYRALGARGAYQIQGYLTSSSQTTSNTAQGSQTVRGYLAANGTWQLDPYWTLSTSIRAVTDKTFLLRYSISNDDRLRSVAKAERIDDDSYLSIAGWAFQTLVPGQIQKQQPIAVPSIDYRRLIPDPLLGGTFTIEANTLALTRLEGQDTQRAFASAEWEKWLLTPMGQIVTLTAFARGDLYHSDQNDQTQTVVYQGVPGWEKRGIAAAAIDVRWPFVGELFGGTQQITPRVQIVGSPHTKNLVIPDEDSRAVDLQDTNLFALNRFSGYDRWEDGTRITYGVEYDYNRPKLSVRTLLGQSYRFSDKPDLFPDGTGLSGQMSDYVGRVAVRYGNFVSVTDRFRLDKSTFAIRTNEIDATFGSASTYLEVGYLNLNRHISQAIEDLRDHEEVRLGARVAISKRWSFFGSTTLDLTGDNITDSDIADGFDPVQSRVGIDYTDDCFEFSLDWHRNLAAVGDARLGSAVEFRLVLKNLGR